MPVPPNRAQLTTGDAPLDPIQEVLVEMWTAIILDKIRQQLAEGKQIGNALPICGDEPIRP